MTGRKNSPRLNFVVAVRQLGKEEADATRTQIVHYLLRRVVTDLKARLDPASFLNCGWNELEALLTLSSVAACTRR